MPNWRTDDTAELRSAGLLLRSWLPQDIDQVWQACQDLEIQRCTIVPAPYEMSDAEAFVVTAPERWVAGLPSFGIFAADGQHMHGSIGFVRSPDDGVLEIGYWLAAECRGLGVATCAVRMVCEWAFGDPTVHRIEWMANVGNEPSLTRSRSVAAFRSRACCDRGRVIEASVLICGWPAYFARTSRPLIRCGVTEVSDARQDGYECTSPSVGARQTHIAR